MDRNNIVTTMKDNNIHKDIFLKTLNKGVFTKFNDKLTKKNTIIVDDNPVKYILNNYKNVLLLVS